MTSLKKYLTSEIKDFLFTELDEGFLVSSDLAFLIEVPIPIRQEDLKAFLHPLGQVGTQWDLGCSLLKKAEFSKVQDCLKRNRKSSEITL